LKQKQVDQKKENDHFIIDNDQKANWALRKIRHLKQKKKENQDFADTEIEAIQKEIDEVNQWLKSENCNLDNDIEYMESMLRVYAEQLKSDDPKLKTHKLPFGQLQFRKQRDKWKYDNDKLLEFAENNLEDIIKIKKQVDKRKLKKKIKVVGSKAVVADTGEVIGGIEVIKRGEKFKVKTDV
ncbi:MAG: host-nuclease inhibitor Gam family protein, partial [bacterium]